MHRENWLVCLVLASILCLLVATTCFLVKSVALEREHQALIRIANLQQHLMQQFEGQVAGMIIASSFANPKLVQIETIMQSINRTLDTVETSLQTEREERKNGEIALWQNLQTRHSPFEAPVQSGAVLLKAHLHD